MRNIRYTQIHATDNVPWTAAHPPMNENTMRKIKLNPDELKVASFRTSHSQEARGTVQAFESVGDNHEYADSEATACLCTTMTSWPTISNLTDPSCAKGC